MIDFSLNTADLIVEGTRNYLSPWSVDLLNILGIQIGEKHEVSYLALTEAFGVDKFFFTTLLVSEVENKRPISDRNQLLTIWTDFSEKSLRGLEKRQGSVLPSTVEDFSESPELACADLARLAHNSIAESGEVNLESWFWVEQALWARNKSRGEPADLSYRGSVYGRFLNLVSRRLPEPK